MGVLSEFMDAAIGVVKVGPKLDRAQRQEIRDVIGQLADELDRALTLTEAYLAGARNSRDAADMAAYFREAPNKLMQGFNEYKICGGLYALEDRFQRAFDPARLSVSAGNLQQFRRLISSLGYGERMIIDDLDDLMIRLRSLADDIDQAPHDEYAGVRDQVLAVLRLEEVKLRNKKKEIKSSTREAFRQL
jgi:hypothetical protein